MNTPLFAEQVIIYRSRTEQALDNLINDNPEYILYIVLGVLALLTLVWGYDKLTTYFRRKAYIRRNR